MATSKVTRNYQVTIPAKIRKLLHIEEGATVDFHVEGGAVVLKAKVMVDSDQAWFWTKQWQEGEREASEDIRRGRITKFKSVKEMRKRFDRRKK
jgi:AbrB family looped-hinge helix DNA binding protein